jgi:hypothetical protein
MNDKNSPDIFSVSMEPDLCGGVRTSIGQENDNEETKE